MKITYTTPNDRLTFEMEVTTGKQAFEVVAAIQELFEEPSCGCCDSASIRLDVREFDSNKYFKAVCNDCGAQLDYGQHKDGKGLFVKRWDKENKRAIPNKGWYIYKGSNGSPSPANPKQTQPAGTGQYRSQDHSDDAPF